MVGLDALVGADVDRVAEMPGDVGDSLVQGGWGGALDIFYSVVLMLRSCRGF